MPISCSSKFKCNANLKILLYARLHIKLRCWKFHVLINLRFSSYLPVKFVFFLKVRLLFNIFYCFSMFGNKHFINPGCVYLKKLAELQWETFGILFLCEDEDIGRFSHLHYCTLRRFDQEQKLRRKVLFHWSWQLFVSCFLLSYTWCLSFFISNIFCFRIFKSTAHIFLTDIFQTVLIFQRASLVIDKFNIFIQSRLRKCVL